MKSKKATTVRGRKKVIVLRDPSKTSSVLRGLGFRELPTLHRHKTLHQDDKGRLATGLHPLGVVVAPLEETEIKSLGDLVLSVTENRRFGPAQTQRGLPQPTSARVPTATPTEIDMRHLQGYLHGLSSVASVVASYLDGLPGGFPRPGEGTPPPQPELPSARDDDDEEWSFALSLIGIKPGYSVATGKGVKVAVLDTGVDLDHPDFAGRFEDDSNVESFVPGESVDDGNGHGTHVAGIIAGAAESSGGKRYSVAPDVELLVGKVLGDDGFGDLDNILEGIAWAAVMGARVINLSLAETRPLDAWFNWDYEVLAERLAEGETPCILIAAAGNKSDRNAVPPTLAPVANPAASPSIVAVAACDDQRAPGWFSNAELDTIGLLDVTAPGVDIYSANNDGSFRLDSGTSMAAPHVSGLAALRLELNPNLSVAGLRAELREAVRRPPPPAARRDYGQGIVTAP